MQDKFLKVMAEGTYMADCNAKNGAGSDTMSDQEVTPQINSYYSFRLFIIIYKRE